MSADDLNISVCGPAFVFVFWFACAWEEDVLTDGLLSGREKELLNPESRGVG